MVMEGDLIIYKIGFSWLADMVAWDGVLIYEGLMTEDDRFIG